MQGTMHRDRLKCMWTIAISLVQIFIRVHISPLLHVRREHCTGGERGIVGDEKVLVKRGDPDSACMRELARFSYHSHRMGCSPMKFISFFSLICEKRRSVQAWSDLLLLATAVQQHSSKPLFGKKSCKCQVQALARMCGID